MAKDVELTATVYQDNHDRWGRQYTGAWSTFWAPRLARHDEGEKIGVAISPGLTDGARGKDHVTHRTLVALDVEIQNTGQVPPDPKLFFQLAQIKRTAMAIWTTHGHTPLLPRYRIVIPLDVPIDLRKLSPGLDRMMSAVAAAQFPSLVGVLDIGKLGSSSLFYLGRHPPGGDYWSGIVEGDIQSGSELFAVSMMAHEKDAMKKAQLEALRDANKFSPEIKALMAVFNDGHEVADLLGQYGYIRQGDRWKSPLQHGNASTVILPDHSNWVSFSESDISAGVGRTSEAGDTCFGDAFQLFVYYEHRGSFRAAIAALRERYGKPGDDT